MASTHCPSFLSTTPADLSAHLPSGSAGSFTDSSFFFHSCLWEGPEAGLDIPFFPQADDENPVLMASPMSLSQGNTQIFRHDLSPTLQNSLNPG